MHIVDSAVSLGATSKGRSSARTLRRALLQGAALQLGFGLFPMGAFGPTRLNVSDAPSRDAPLPEPMPHSVVSALKPPDLYLASGFRQLTRPLSNWLRLSCLLVGFRTPSPIKDFLCALTSPWRHERPLAGDSSSGREQASHKPHKNIRRDAWIPGEGPLRARNSQDTDRQQRRSLSALPEGRPVLPRTRTNRARLLGEFDSWLAGHGSSLRGATISQALVNWELYDAAGRTGTTVRQ